MTASLLFCACALLVAGHAGVSAQTAHSIAPTLYTLDLFLDTDKNIFSGSLVIDAEVQTGGAVSFTLNNNGLEIATVSVVQGGANIFSAMVTNQTEQTTKISTSQGLTTGSSVKVTISYQGNVSTEPTGLFSFVDKGKTIYMTNLYPIHARKLFPCFDEPGVAAEVALSLTIPSSNGQLIASSDIASTSTLSNGYKFYQLSTTAVPIAPYSLFFTLGDWDSDSYSLGLKNTQVYLPPSLSGKGTLIDGNLIYASNISNIVELIPYYFSTTTVNIFISPVLASNSYTGLRTVVLKTDISVIDLDETTTAIEKSNLLQITTAFYKLFYGTYSRPATWGNNWLAESIPIYLSYGSLDKVKVYGSSNEALVTGLYEEVLSSSSADDSPVTYTASALTKPDEIMSFISSSGVKKGVYALKTLETFIDAPKLQSSLLAYLIATNGTTMESENFMNFLNSSLQSSIHIIGGSIVDVLKPMVSETGYPLIQLSRYDQTFTMLKSPFTVLSSTMKQSYAEVSQLRNVANWLIPVSVATSMSPTTLNASSVYFVPSGSSNTQVVLSGTYPTNGWALLDLEGKGMMRVSYDPTSMLLFKANGLAMFTPAMRAKLITDAFGTAESGNQGADWIATLAFLEYLDNETELAPWQAALTGFRRMWSWIYANNNANLTAPFVSYWQTRLSNIYKNLGTTGSNTDGKDPLRSEVVSAMCELGGANCITDLAAQYQSLVNDGTMPSADMYSVVLCYGLRGFTTAEQWTSVYQNYVKSGKWYSQQLMDSHYAFLACPAVGAPINEYLTNVLIKTQATMFPVNQVLPAVKAILSKPEHVDQVLSFLVQNQMSLNITQDLQAEIIRELGDRLSTSAQVQQLQTLTNTTRTLSPSLIAAVKSAMAKGAAKASWVAHVKDNVQKGLNGATPSPPPTTPTVTPQPTGSPTSSGGPTSPTPTPTPKPGSSPPLSTVSIFTLFASYCLLKLAQ